MRRLCLLLLLICPALFAEPGETDWLDLMPEQDRLALEQMPEIDHLGAEADGSFGAPGGLKQAGDLPAVMYSRNTVAAMDGRRILLGGYPVPLESDEKGRSTEFFLVPYPGACIHVPPPPPNQIVLVRYPAGVPIEDIYEPLWVSGRLRIEEVSNALADAVYTLDASEVRAVE